MLFTCPNHIPISVQFTPQNRLYPSKKGYNCIPYKLETFEKYVLDDLHRKKTLFLFYLLSDSQSFNTNISEMDNLQLIYWTTQDSVFKYHYPLDRFEHKSPVSTKDG